MDETYIKVKGRWGYLYRTVDIEEITLSMFYLPKIGVKRPLNASLTKTLNITGCQRRSPQNPIISIIGVAKAGYIFIVYFIPPVGPILKSLYLGD
jgi:hypothetical protein